MSQGKDEFDGADDEFEKARAEDNAFDAVRAEDSATRARSQRSSNMSGCAVVTANEPK